MNRLLSRSKQSPNRFTPKLESLDNRIVPSCTWNEVGGVLTIYGDQYANVVDIEDDGTALTITCDGDAVPVSAGVTTVVLTLASGNDEVNYTLTGDLVADTTRRLRVNLANGDDTFNGTLEAGLLDNASLDIGVWGKNGKDEINFAAPASNIAAGASLHLGFGGGNGKDVIDVIYGGQVLGDLTLFGCGGNGKDVLAADLTIDAGSTGNVDARLRGHNAPDYLALHVMDNSGDDGLPETVDVSTLTSLSAVVIGNRGPNTADVTDNVDVFTCRRR
jgi:hypothetical protein